MTAQTGRTVKRWVSFYVDDSAGTLRQIPVNAINGVGLDYEEQNLTAWQDAIQGALLAHPSCSITISGPFDTSAAAAATSLSGSHTILSALPGGSTPLALDVRIGIRHVWEAGEPTFGITGTTANGFLCKSYAVDLDAGTYTAVFVMAAGSAAPEWAAAAHT